MKHENIALVTNNYSHFVNTCNDLYEKAKPNAAITKSNHKITIHSADGETTYHFVSRIDHVEGRAFDGFELLDFAHDIENLSDIIEHLNTHNNRGGNLLE